MKWFDMDSIWPGIYLKPTRTDLVLDAIVGLLILAIWGIVLGAFFIPAWFPGSIERKLVMVVMQLTILFGVVYFWSIRYSRPFRRKIFDRNPPDNSERRHRFHARISRICAIVGCLFILWEIVKEAFALTDMKWLDTIFRFSFAATVAALFVWIIIRDKIMK